MTKDDIIRTAQKIATQCSRSTPPTWTHEFAVSYIMSMVELAIEEEREACAKVREEYQDAVDRQKWPNGYQCAAAIRARGQA